MLQRYLIKSESSTLYLISIHFGEIFLIWDRKYGFSILELSLEYNKTREENWLTYQYKYLPGYHRHVKIMHNKYLCAYKTFFLFFLQSKIFIVYVLLCIFISSRQLNYKSKSTKMMHSPSFLIITHGIVQGKS